MFRQRKQVMIYRTKRSSRKYYEMDGALRAYANRMAVLGLLCGTVAVIALDLFAYVRLQPPVVIRVDQSGEATVVGGDTVRLSRWLVPPVVAAKVKPATGPARAMRYRRPGFGAEVPHDLPDLHTGERRAAVRRGAEYDDAQSCEFSP